MWQALKRAWSHAKLIRAYVEPADQEGAWTKQDAGNLAAFMNTPTGQLLGERLRNFVYRSAIVATQHPSDAKYHVGVARGTALSVGFFQDQYLPALQREPEAEKEAPMPYGATNLSAVLEP